MRILCFCVFCKTVYSAVLSACCSETAAEDSRQLFFHWWWNCEGSDLNLELQDAAAAVMSDKKMWLLVNLLYDSKCFLKAVTEKSTFTCLSQHCFLKVLNYLHLQMDSPNSCEVCARELPRSSQNRVLNRKDVCTFLLTAMASCLCLGRWCRGGKQQVCCLSGEQITCTTCSRDQGTALTLPALSVTTAVASLVTAPHVYRGLDTASSKGIIQREYEVLSFFSGHTGNVVGKAELLGSCFAGNAGTKPAQSKPQRGRSFQAEVQSLSVFSALPVFLWVWKPLMPCTTAFKSDKSIVAPFFPLTQKVLISLTCVWSVFQF